MTGWEPAAIAAVSTVLTLILGKLFDRWMNRDTQQTALTGQQLMDGATIRSELWKRLETVEAELKQERHESRDRELEWMKAKNLQDAEISRLRSAEEECQRRLREFGREMAEWRERMAQERKN